LNPSCDTAQGLSVPTNSSVLASFCQTQEKAWVAAGKTGTDPATQSVCQLRELVNVNRSSQVPGVLSSTADFDPTGQCTNSGDPGWCYAIDAKGCAQSIEFSTGSPPPGGIASLQCIYASGDGGT
jgi:hypothetical protein